MDKPVVKLRRSNTAIERRFGTLNRKLETALTTARLSGSLEELSKRPRPTLRRQNSKSFSHIDKLHVPVPIRKEVGVNFKHVLMELNEFSARNKRLSASLGDFEDFTENSPAIQKWNAEKSTPDLRNNVRRQPSSVRQTLAVTTSLSSPSCNKHGYLGNHYNAQYNNRQTMDHISLSEHAQKFSFDKATKIAFDGEIHKINKDGAVMVENNDLVFYGRNNNRKVILKNVNSCTKQISPKGFELQGGNKTVKVYITEKRNLLQKFFKKRISQEDLIRKGIYKNEPIFGNTLDYLYDKDKRPVPLFVLKIIELIEMPKNIVSPGLYRASGNVATMQKIRLKIDSNKLEVLDEHKHDIDVLAGTLKMFFRELKNPLIGNDEFNKLTEVAVSNTPEKEKYAIVGDIINTMALPHKETLKTIMEHLLKVVEHQSENHMSIQNMSICWGPSLLNQTVSLSELLQVSTMKNAVVELLLHTFDSTFDCTLKPADSTMNLSYSTTSDLQTIGFSRSLSVDSEISHDDSRYSITKDNFILSTVEMILNKPLNQNLFRAAEDPKLVAKIVQKASKKKSRTLKNYMAKASVIDLGEALRRYLEESNIYLLPKEVFEDVMHNGDEARERFNASLTKLTPNAELLLRFLRDICKSNQGVIIRYNIANTWFRVFYDHPLEKIDIGKVYATIDRIIGFLTENPTNIISEDAQDCRTSLYDNVPHLPNIAEENVINCDTFNCCNNRPRTFIYTKSDEQLKMVPSRSIGDLAKELKVKGIISFKDKKLDRRV